ncbi:MAG: choice-of-anchor L domain-containing protein [Myxococcota bacterium]
MQPDDDGAAADDDGSGSEPQTTSAEGTDPGEGTGPATSTSGNAEAGGGSTDGANDDSNDDGPPIVLDVGGISDAGNGSCVTPPAANCDHLDDDPWHAFGLNCPGGAQTVTEEINLAGPAQLHVHSGNLGTHVPAPFPPQEGDKFVILSSGNASELTIPGFYASTAVGFGGGPLPPPLDTAPVSATDDCASDPSLIGSGDCSNTIQVQWDQGDGEAHDYAEMRFTAEVPQGTPGFAYNFAMFSTEYPVYYQSMFNDMYIAWLESEIWTGNVSFDDMGNPISLNAGFLDYKDAPNDFDCPAPCAAPELAGTAMEGHAGTRWLTTSAGVVPGETMELVLAVFDLSDGILDTVIILDNFHWACVGGPPVTIPG